MSPTNDQQFGYQTSGCTINADRCTPPCPHCDHRESSQQLLLNWIYNRSIYIYIGYITPVIYPILDLYFNPPLLLLTTAL